MKRRFLSILAFIILIGIPVYDCPALVCSSIFSRASRNEKHENSIPELEPNKIAIVGAGVYGAAVGSILALSGFDVNMWAARSTSSPVLDEINSSHTHPKLIDKRTKAKIPLPQKLHGVYGLEETVNRASVILVAVSSPGVTEVSQKLAALPYVQKKSPIIVALSKGLAYLEEDKKTKGNPRLILDVMENYLPEHYKKNLVYLTGPSIAWQLALGKHTGLTIASRNPHHAETVKEKFEQGILKDILGIKVTRDVTGAQVCAAAKNPYAIMYGILVAAKDLNLLDIEDNTLAEFFIAAKDEMTFLAKRLSSGHSFKATVGDLPGTGDLFVTMKSGRNSRFGTDAAMDYFSRQSPGMKEMSFQEFIEKTQNTGNPDDTIEGIDATLAFRRLALQHEITLPIIEILYSILYNNALLEDEIPKLLKTFGNAFPNGYSAGSLYDKAIIWGRQGFDHFFRGNKSLK